MNAQNVKEGKFGTRSSGKPTRVISVTSGKGGVGKTLTTVNIAVAARRLGLSVLIFDGDLGLANVDVVLGLKARYNIRDVLDGNASLQDIIVDGPLGIAVIPSGSGVSSLTQLSYAQKQQILAEIQAVEAHYDLLLIDTGAGISDNVISLNKAAQKMVVVTTPEPHALTDAYALIKVMAEEHSVKSPNLLINMARSADEALKVHERIAEVARRFLDINVSYLGHVPLDPQVPKSVMQRRAASEQSTFTVSGQAWNDVARKLLSDPEYKGKNGSMDAHEFWRNLLWTDAATPGRAIAGY
jgi:flagellar biosynthesis protein FlhG